MLVLSRKVGQEIVVGENVRITITKISGNRVTIGVQAPDNVRILRGELEPVVCSFDDSNEESSQVCSPTIPLASDGLTTIPFVPPTAK